MKYLVVLFATIAFACGSHEGGLRVKFAIGLFNMGETFFYDIPRNMSGVTELGWTKQPRADDHLPSLELYCADKLTFCALYDPTGYLAGLQVALDQEKFTGAVFDWAVQGFIEWEPASDGKRYWTNQQYFVDENYLAIDENERISSRDQHKTLQAGGVWVWGINRELLQISNTTEAIENSAFTKQACIPWMGQHYYYNMSETTECTSEGLMPWFVLVDDGELIGTGLKTFGQLPAEDGKRDWFERPSKLGTEFTVNNAPDCLYDLADSPGELTMHIYYIDDPRTMLCIF